MSLSHGSARPLWRRGLAAGVALALIVGAAGFWSDVRDQLVPKRWVEIEPGRLFRSGQLSARLVGDVLAEQRVGVVVDLTHPDADDADQRAEARAIQALGIQHVRLPLDGSGTGDVRHYAGAIAAIARARSLGTPVLVHCAAGARRTGGVIATYQLLVAGARSERAYAELDRYGRTPVAETPLLAYLNDNMGTVAGLLVEMGVLERVPEPLPAFRAP